MISNSVASNGAAAWTPAVVIAVCALVFTVASFWWVSVRRGQLKSFAPHTFSASVNAEQVRLIFPLVLYNTGAAPIIVKNLTIRFPNERDSAVLHWTTTRRQVEPRRDDWAFPAVFSVAGRTAHQTFVEFTGQLGFKLNACDYRLVIESKLGHRKKRTTLLLFTLHAGRINNPEHYITYENLPDSLSQTQRKDVQVGLDFAQLGQVKGLEDRGQPPAQE